MPTAVVSSAPPVEKRRHKHLVLILAREFASNLATPTLIADDQGTLVFYNEAAESVVGRPFAEIGEMPLEAQAKKLSLPIVSRIHVASLPLSNYF